MDTNDRIDQDVGGTDRRLAGSNLAGSNLAGDGLDAGNPGDEIGEAVGGISGVLTGAALGSLGGPVGTIIGGIAGAVSGWWAGRAISDAASHASDEDETYYRSQYGAQYGASVAGAGAVGTATGASSGMSAEPGAVVSRPERSYDDVRPAYQIGHLAGRNPDYQGRSFEEVEADLRRGWTPDVSTRHGEWHEVREYARSAFDRSRGRGAAGSASSAR